MYLERKSKDNYSFHCDSCYKPIRKVGTSDIHQIGHFTISIRKIRLRIHKVDPFPPDDKKLENEQYDSCTQLSHFLLPSLQVRKSYYAQHLHPEQHNTKTAAPRTTSSFPRTAPPSGTAHPRQHLPSRTVPPGTAKTPPPPDSTLPAGQHFPPLGQQVHPTRMLSFVRYISG